MNKGRNTAISFTVEDDLMSQAASYMAASRASFASNGDFGVAHKPSSREQRKIQQIQKRARNDYYKQQSQKIFDPFAHKLAKGFGMDQQSVYQNQKRRLEEQAKKLQQQRMNSAKSYTIVFDDARGSKPVIKDLGNVFKMCANKMLDQGHMQTGESRPAPAPRKLPPKPKVSSSKPIQSISEENEKNQESDNESDGNPKWQAKPKSNNFFAHNNNNSNNGRNQSLNSGKPIRPQSSNKPKVPVPPPKKKETKSMTNATSSKKKQNQKDSGKKKYSEVYDGPDIGLVQQLENQLIESTNIGFDDIAELQVAKNLLQQAVLLPRLMPQFFKGIRRATKGILLFGPPGTGKTLLAKAVAKGNVFLNVSASSLASKWRGQSQKLVRLLFEVAKYHAPSVIFFDEIDAIGSKRSEEQSEANRKVKTQLLVHMDGVSANPDKQVFVLAATNRPWDLDQALRRRLEKRIFIPLPSEEGRKKMFLINLKDIKLSKDINWDKLAKLTKDYSGADIAIVCRQAAYMPLRRKLAKMGGIKNLGQPELIEKQLDVELVETDFLEALKNVNKSVGNTDLKKYQAWMKEFGSS